MKPGRKWPWRVEVKAGTLPPKGTGDSVQAFLGNPILWNGTRGLGLSLHRLNRTPYTLI